MVWNMMKIKTDQQNSRHFSASPGCWERMHKG